MCNFYFTQFFSHHFIKVVTIKWQTYYVFWNGWTVCIRIYVCHNKTLSQRIFKKWNLSFSFSSVQKVRNLHWMHIVPLLCSLCGYINRQVGELKPNSLHSDWTLPFFTYSILLLVDYFRHNPLVLDWSCFLCLVLHNPGLVMVKVMIKSHSSVSKIVYFLCLLWIIFH